jgi:hypothetical protein
MQDHASGARVLMQPASGSLSLRSPGAAARAAPLRREAGTSLQAPRMLVEAPSQAAAAASGPGFRGSFLKWQGRVSDCPSNRTGRMGAS